MKVFIILTAIFFSLRLNAQEKNMIMQIWKNGIKVSYNVNEIDSVKFIDSEEEYGQESKSAIVINTGNWGSNDASIMRYNLNNNTITSDLYLASNQENLGDLAQDGIKYGSKYYVAVSSSSKVVVLDTNMKIVKTIPFTKDSKPTSPRYLTSANGKVYVTAYDGCVTRIDTASLSITGSVEVGDHPEALSYANGKLYVNISGYGSGSTVAVVDEASFTKTKDLNVVLYPYSQSLVAKDGNVYFVSNGNYAGASWLTEDQYVYATVQCIDTKTDKVTEVCRGTYIATYEDNLYVLYSEYYLPSVAKAFIYNITTKTESNFCDISQFSSINGISVDPTTGDIYIFDSPWGSAATICGPIQKDGTPAHKVAAGYYTCKMIF